MPIPVLVYHHVSPCGDLALNVVPDVFERQMRYLHEHGYRTLTLDELVQYTEGRLRLEEKAVVLTFDDGWLDNYLFALPVLKRYGFRAAIFLITDLVNHASDGPRRDEYTEKYARLSWEKIREMTATGLFGAYSHTRTHRDCKNISRDDLLAELEGSRRAIEERLDTDCPYLCWPFGRFDGLAVEMAGKAGYKALFTTVPGVVGINSDPLFICRVGVPKGTFWFGLKMRMCVSPGASSVFFYIRGMFRKLKRRMASFRPGQPQELEREKGHEPGIVDEVPAP